MEIKLVPAKNQRFDIGRIINFTKCDCERCDFMHCPKNNYALKMVQKKYSVQEFFEANKDNLVKKRCLRLYFDYETIANFMEACVSGFPKGTYWKTDRNEAIELVTRNRSKYGADFLTRARIDFYTDFPITYYSGCSDRQEKLAIKIQGLLKQLDNLLIAELANQD